MTAITTQESVNDKQHPPVEEEENEEEEEAGVTTGSGRSFAISND
jgi:hypothetical protein